MSGDLFCENRATNDRITKNFSSKSPIECIIGKLHPPITVTKTIDKSGRKKYVGCCYLCNEQGIRKKRKTRKNCESCQKPICSEHSVNIVKCVACK